MHTIYQWLNTKSDVELSQWWTRALEHKLSHVLTMIEAEITIRRMIATNSF